MTSPSVMRKHGILSKYHDLQLTDYYGFYKSSSDLHKKFPAHSRDKIKREWEDAKDIAETILLYFDNIDRALKLGKGIFFFGNSGTGKSLLMMCIAKEALNKKYSVRVVSAQGIVDEFAKSWDSEYGQKDFKTRIMNVKLLCIEEMNKEFFNSVTIPTLTRVIKYREANCLATMITCNEDIQIIEKKYSPTIASAIKGSCKLLRFDSDLDWRDIEQENWESDLQHK